MGGGTLSAPSDGPVGPHQPLCPGCGVGVWGGSLGTRQLLAVAFGVRNKILCQSLASPRPQHDQPCGSGQGTGGCWAQAASPSTGSPTPPVHTQSFLSHGSWTRSHMCVLAHAPFTRMLHPAGCYLLTNAWCTPTLAPAAVSHPEHTQSRCTLTPGAISHLARGAHPSLVHTQSWSTLSPGAVSHLARAACPSLVHTGSHTCHTLTPGAHSPPSALPCHPQPSPRPSHPLPAPRPAQGTPGRPALT